MRNDLDLLFQTIHLFNTRLEISIRFFDPFGIMGNIDGFHELFSNAMIHDMEYCMLVKGNERLWRKCILCKWKVMSILKNTKKPFYGKCYFGVGEYIYPIIHNDIVIGYVSAYGYHDRASISIDKMLMLLVGLTGSQEERIKRTYYHGLQPQPNAFEELSVILRIIEDMIQKMLHSLPEKEKTTALCDGHLHLSVMQALDYINQMYANDIKTKEIAAFCHISESYLQHLFLKTYGCGIHEMLIERRLNEAKRLLIKTTLPVYAIAERCGFSDANYLSAAFHKRFHITCLKYRQRLTKYQSEGEPIREK